MRTGLFAVVTAAGLLATGCMGGSGSQDAAAPVVVHHKPTPAASEPAAKVAPRDAVLAAAKATEATGSAQFTVLVRPRGGSQHDPAQPPNDILRYAGNVDFTHTRMHVDVYAYGDATGQPQRSLGRVVLSNGREYVSWADGSTSQLPVKPGADLLTLTTVLDGALTPVRDAGMQRGKDLGPAPLQVYELRVGSADVAAQLGLPAGTFGGRQVIRQIWVDGQGRLVRVDDILDLSNLSLPKALAGLPGLLVSTKLTSFGVPVFQHVAAQNS